MQEELAEKVYDYLIQGKTDVVKYIIENQVINCFGTYQHYKVENGIEAIRTLAFFVFDDGSKIIKEIIRYKNNAKIYYRNIKVQSKNVEIRQENIEGQFDISAVTREYWFFKI